ncbi:MAG: VWA domain-containing protein [Pyrinomonadaceae bacterium]
MVYTRFRQFSLILSAILTIQVLAYGQTPTPKPTPDDEVIKVSSRLVVVPVSITDAAGQAVTGLTAQDFRISEEGRQQTVESIGTADVVPLEIALLFDVSASTDKMFKFEQETAAKFLQDVMRTNDRATVFTIAGKTQLVAPRDTPERAAAAVRSIVPTKDATAFFDTVGDAAAYLRKNAPEGTRRVIVVISDGEDTNSSRIAKAIQDGYRKVGEKINTIDNKALYQLTVKNRNDASVQERLRILRSLQDADTVFYSINPAGSSFQLNKISVFGQENMQKFAEDTGGTAFLPKFQPIDTKDEYQNAISTRKNTELLDRIFRQLANELRSQYLIQYYSEAEFPLNKFVKLDVGLNKKPELRVRARQGYYVKN